jgi:hypothetical protein
MTSLASLGLPAALVAAAITLGVAPVSGQPVGDVMEVSLPAYSWTMTIPAKGFVKERDETAQGDFAMVEYLIPESAGARIQQKNLCIYFAKEGTCGYLHVSKPRLTEADQVPFARILEGARIVARP